MIPGYERSAELAARASAAIPNGIFGHRRTMAFADGVARTIPDAYPHFVERASGCSFDDVDGNRYLDYLCGYGPMIVGYANQEVDAAVAEVVARGESHNFPTELTITLAERILERNPSAGWAAFALNGTDAVTMALVIARAATGRHTVVMAEGAFHGNHTWASAGPGWGEADRTHTRTVRWGDADALAAALAAEPVAAVVLCPYEQLVGAENRMPPADYWRRVRAACTAAGAVLIVDDIRSGFRVDQAGTCAHFGIEPDLLVQSKAMANGYPVAAIAGTEGLRDAASTVFISGTFWGHAPALAAALVTLDLVEEPGAIDQMAHLGRLLTDGLTSIAAGHGHQLLVSGPPALPQVRFAADTDFSLACGFAEALAVEGSFVHPTHNWFLSMAHTEADIESTLDHASVAMRRLPEGAS